MPPDESTRSLRPAYGNALHTAHPQLNFEDSQTYVGTTNIGRIYSQPCPPCSHLAKHRVANVVSTFEFPVTDPAEVKDDGTLKQANEVMRPRTRWSGARCASKRAHCQTHARAHELYGQDESGWKRPAPDFTAADEALELYKSAKKTFCSKEEGILDTTLVTDITQRADTLDRACMRFAAGESVAAKHDKAVMLDLAASVRDAELRVRVLSQMSAEKPAFEAQQTSTLQKIIAHAEEMINRGEAWFEYTTKGGTGTPPLRTEPFTPGEILFVNEHEAGQSTVERIAGDIARYELNDDTLAEKVYSAVKELVPGRIKMVGSIARAGAQSFCYHNTRKDHKGKTLEDLVEDIVRPRPERRYFCVRGAAVQVAQAAFPMLSRRTGGCDFRCGDLPAGLNLLKATTATAESVLQAAKAINVTADAQVKELATSLGYHGGLESIESEPTGEEETAGTKQTATAAAIAAIFQDLLLSELTSVACEASADGE